MYRGNAGVDLFGRVKACCGTLYAPWRQSAGVAYRPRPQRLAKSRPSGGCSLAWRLRARIAQVASSATGGAPLAPLPYIFAKNTRGRKSCPGLY